MLTYIYAKFYIVRKALLCKRDIYSKFLNKSFLNAIHFIIIIIIIIIAAEKNEKNGH